MGLKDKVAAKVAATNDKNRPGSCAVRRAYGLLSSDDAADLRELLAAPTDPRDPGYVTTRAITQGLGEALQEIGENPISETTIRTHRNGVCGCGPR